MSCLSRHNHRIWSLLCILLVAVGLLPAACGEGAGDGRPDPRETLVVYQESVQRSGYDAAVGTFDLGTAEQQRTLRTLLKLTKLYVELEKEMSRQFGGVVTQLGMGLKGGVLPRWLFEGDLKALRFTITGDVASAEADPKSKSRVVMVWRKDRWLLDPATLGVAPDTAARDELLLAKHAKVLEDHIAAIRAKKFASRDEAKKAQRESVEAAFR